MVSALLSLVAISSLPIELKLQSDKKSFAVGENINFKLSVKNRSANDLLFTPVIDGSILNRSPLYKFWVQKKSADWEPVTWKLGFCGNSNPLRAEDFLSVPANKTVVLPQGWWAPFQYSQLGVPGTYNIKLVCDTTQPLDRWIGGPLPPEAHEKTKAELKPLYDKVPKGIFETKPISIQIKSK